MTITYPRPLPCGVVTRNFTPSYVTGRNRLAKGTVQVRQYGETLWRADFTTAPLARAEHQEWEAWLDSADGGGQPFLAHDPLKPFPVAYRSTAFLALLRPGGFVFDGKATLTAIATSGFTLAQLPIGLTIKAGDMVGLTEAGRYGLWRVSEDAVAGPTGQLVLTVKPRVPLNLFSMAAIANFVRPACLMTVDPDSISTPRSAGARGIVSFSGIQRLV